LIASKLIGHDPKLDRFVLTQYLVIETGGNLKSAPVPEAGKDPRDPGLLLLFDFSGKLEPGRSGIENHSACTTSVPHR
jgi:hypothetical protein